MRKEYKIILILFLLGCIITIIGAFLKITHNPNSNFVLALGMVLEIISLIMLILTILKKK